MAKPPSQRPGKVIKRDIGGFPVFFTGREQRVITANPWAFADKYIQLYGAKNIKQRGCAFVEQAHDFFQAAPNQIYASRPLLYFYSFLNLAKAALLVRGYNFPAKLTHGIEDPKVNSKKKFRMEGQVVHIPGRAHDRSAFFPEFLFALDAAHLFNRDLKICELLGLIPSIHRTYVQVTDNDERLLRIEKMDVVHKKDGNNWVRVYFKKGNPAENYLRKQIAKRKAFSNFFALCASDIADHYCYESIARIGKKKGIDNALTKLAADMSKCGVNALLVSNGYRYYLVDDVPRNLVPNLVATYAIAFYLGSITRYKPHDFDVIASGPYRWLIEEFLATEPIQFVYQLLGWMSGREVVQPQALRHG